MTNQFKCEDVEQYLRAFSSETPSDDFGILLRLVLAGIDNLRQKAADSDILENAHAITDDQASFLQRLIECRAESIEWYKDYIGHSSKTGLL